MHQQLIPEAEVSWLSFGRIYFLLFNTKPRCDYGDNYLQGLASVDIMDQYTHTVFQHCSLVLVPSSISTDRTTYNTYIHI